MDKWYDALQNGGNKVDLGNEELGHLKGQEAVIPFVAKRCRVFETRNAVSIAIRTVLPTLDRFSVLKISHWAWSIAQDSSSHHPWDNTFAL